MSQCMMIGRRPFLAFAVILGFLIFGWVAFRLSTDSTRTVVTNQNETNSWGIELAQVPEAWYQGATGKGIMIAIVDTGIDSHHPDLRDNIVIGYNAILNQEGIKAAQDYHGHGTKVAGVAAASLNGVGIVGVAYDAKLMGIKVMEGIGKGDDELIARGIRWAADHGANIINLSFASDHQGDRIRDAISYAVTKGCIVIGAAGNIGDNSKGPDGVSYPAADPNVLAVSALSKDLGLASFSFAGPAISFTAPGEEIVTTTVDEFESAYTTSKGTSLAAPFLAGAAAIVWSAQPDWTADEVVECLKSSAIDLGAPGKDEHFGYGLVNPYQALKNMNSLDIQ